MAYLPPLVASPDFLTAQFGSINGKAAKFVVIFGRRTLGWRSTALYGDVSNYLDTSQDRNNDVVLGATYFVRSSSALDTAGGTGAQRVRVVYLDAAGVQQAVEVNLNGLTGVSLGSAISYIQWMEVTAVGSNTVAAGSITIASVVGAPVTAQIVEMISVGDTRSRSGRYKVPAGFVCHLIEWAAEALGGSQDFAVRATVTADDRALNSVFHPQETVYVPGNTTSVGMILHYISCPAGAEIKVSAIPSASAAANRANTTLSLLLLST